MSSRLLLLFSSDSAIISDSLIEGTRNLSFQFGKLARQYFMNEALVINTTSRQTQVASAPKHSHSGRNSTDELQIGKRRYENTLNVCRKERLLLQR